jgi:hemerythrin
MSSHGSDLKTYQENIARYQEFKALLATIDEVLQQRSATIDQVSDMIAQLGDRLAKHFASEEDGGYFAEALSNAPQLVSKANALLAQHPKMCTLAESLAADLQARKGTSTDWWARTSELFQAFRDELMRHETQENGLLQDAYHQDIGTTD